ncbi:hypothetical protein JYU34_006398 [Plutella xylostella]|uniref:Uncharacterized protein n=1 Tax=Plutella xylostella TaxID=51655 RepID=A0ABQ7QRX0_PLUXY|nr:hypothetical protein JYU34_006398 [Plutella xylostella]
MPTWRRSLLRQPAATKQRGHSNGYMQPTTGVSSDPAPQASRVRRRRPQRPAATQRGVSTRRTQQVPVAPASKPATLVFTARVSSPCNHIPAATQRGVSTAVAKAGNLQPMPATRHTLPHHSAAELARRSLAVSRVIDGGSFPSSSDRDHPGRRGHQGRRGRQDHNPEYAPSGPAGYSQSSKGSASKPTPLMTTERRSPSRRHPVAYRQHGVSKDCTQAAPLTPAALRPTARSRTRRPAASMSSLAVTTSRRPFARVVDGGSPPSSTGGRFIESGPRRPTGYQQPSMKKACKPAPLHPSCHPTWHHPAASSQRGDSADYPPSAPVSKSIMLVWHRTPPCHPTAMKQRGDSPGYRQPSPGTPASHPKRPQPRKTRPAGHPVRRETPTGTLPVTTPLATAERRTLRHRPTVHRTVWDFHWLPPASTEACQQDRCDGTPCALPLAVLQLSCAPPFAEPQFPRCIYTARGLHWLDRANSRADVYKACATDDQCARLPVVLPRCSKPARGLRCNRSHS